MSQNLVDGKSKSIVKTSEFCQKITSDLDNVTCPVMRYQLFLVKGI